MRKVTIICESQDLTLQALSSLVLTPSCNLQYSYGPSSMQCFRWKPLIMNAKNNRLEQL